MRGAFRSFDLCVLALNVVLAPVAALRVSHADANASRRYSSCGHDTKLMAECCESMYNMAPGCGCWQKWGGYLQVSELVQAQVFRDGAGWSKRCILGFSGQVDGDKKWERNPVSYITGHDALTFETLCGRDTVHGFAEATKQFFGDPGWTRLARLLAGRECSDGVDVIGTSFGGAFAEILAGCANQGRLSELQARGVPAFRIGRLTTFGAPPTAKTPITNALAQDGCFPGQRIFRASNASKTGSTDLVAFSTSLNGFLHAQQSALQLVELPGGACHVQAHPCRAQATTAAPDWDAIQPYLKKLWDEEGLDFLGGTLKQIQQTHMIESYTTLLEKVSDSALYQGVQEAKNSGGSALHQRVQEAKDVGGSGEQPHPDEPRAQEAYDPRMYRR